MYLREAIESVINQTYRPLECIVVDDGSTDNTEPMITDIQNNTDDQFFLKYIKQSNAGSQVARNTGTSVATGEFIQYLDSDDLLYPRKLEVQIIFLQENIEFDGIFGDWDKGTILNKETIIAPKESNLITQILNGRCIQTLSFLFRRTIVNKTGKWDVLLKRNQEIDFHLSTIIAGGNFIYEPLICGLWRQHTGASISRNSDLIAVLYFFKKWEKLLYEKGLYTPEIEKGILSNCFWFLNTFTSAIFKEKLALLKHIHELDANHAVFSLKKFRICKILGGLDFALKMFLINNIIKRGINSKVQKLRTNILVLKNNKIDGTGC